ncbi:hypothetical protein LCGC14_0370520 [marine sediment metagenome]|uniref:Uncharacterized protein n=1 Tax=marine sediment metagenome TaxID=412755 RepID=A0A0F9VSD6_9ZZZZ|nr:hypothetical protein [Maribacter sp.]HDZ04887.1 hypothetical protein [Maribacter sp.]
MSKFTENIELDARIVFAAMRGGIDGVMEFAFNHRQHFKTANDAVERAKWLKTQSEDYITKVSEKAAKIELMK